MFDILHVKLNLPEVLQECSVERFVLFFENLTHVLLSLFVASQETTTIFTQSMSSISTESASFALSVSRQSDNISVVTPLTSSPALSLMTST